MFDKQSKSPSRKSPVGVGGSSEPDAEASRRISFAGVATGMPSSASGWRRCVARGGNILRRTWWSVSGVEWSLLRVPLFLLDRCHVSMTNVCVL